MGFAMGLLFAKALALSLMDLGPEAGDVGNLGNVGEQNRGLQQHDAWPNALDNAIDVFRGLAGSGKEGARQAYSLIFPGTKWCGQGNKASSYDDLGWFRNTDICCRAHDLCPDSIGSGQVKHGVFNPHEVTLMLCACDHRLELCLHRVDSLAAREISKLFFDFLAPSCLTYDHPVIKCTMTDYSRRCLQYLRDLSAPKVWQLQDVPHWYDPTLPINGASLLELRHQAANALEGQEETPDAETQEHWKALFDIPVEANPPKRFWFF